MGKHYLFLAVAATVMASCANDDFNGDGSVSGPQAIAFNMSTPSMTRAEATKTSTDAATALGNEFIVWGEKNENTATGGSAAATAENIVFDNYRVQYAAGTANTTTSNTKNWEYVGITPYAASTSAYTAGSTASEGTAFVSPSIYQNADTKQTIKYWDFDKPYTFTAVSAKKDDIMQQKVKITKNSTEASAASKGYTIELAEGADAASIYVADRLTKTVSKPADGSTVEAVQLQFRNFQSKIRFGIYETVPGYKAVITGIKYGSEEHTSAGSDKSFGVDGNFVTVGSGTSTTKYTVTYTDANKAQVEIDGTSAAATAFNTTGTNWLSTAYTTGDYSKCIGETSVAATYDKTVGSDTKAYTAILPNPSNTTNLKLQVKFDLYSEDTGEKIEGDYKTVEVPAEYCQWKSNYAYSYIFKITDKSADLYPITFDACVVTDETGNQETITSVTEPSITTFGVSGGKYVYGKNEYAGGDVIYATVVDGSSLATLSAENIKLYTVTATGTQTISEASVANCLTNGTKDTSTDPTTWTSTAGTGNVLTVKSQSYTAADDLLNKVPAEDGTEVTLDGTDKKALKWTATASTTYAIEYIKTSGTETKKYYKIVKVAD